MKKCAIVVMLFSFACNAGELKIVKIETKNGCDIYRLKKDGRSSYLAECRRESFTFERWSEFANHFKRQNKPKQKR